ncbi:hypothetical protein EJ02DRAFT_16312 [Clathrospora elynae]|uniref:ABM domain-containing protein n=1 Tax=Clathrospora elynae TaxID=706981 RepID=A0A6A5SJK9_9PLEO|nr:hypothetical protein EJ02DRAFT_16312 [Clathrospora elynae]
MTIVRILQFHAPSSFAAESEASEALAALKGVKTPQNFMLGTQVRDEGVAQLTSEWLELAKEASPEAESYINGVKIALGSPAAMSHITLQQPAFGPLTFPVVEFVQPFILSSTVTPSFRGKIEADFEKFEGILNI